MFRKRAVIVIIVFFSMILSVLFPHASLSEDEIGEPPRFVTEAAAKFFIVGPGRRWLQ